MTKTILTSQPPYPRIDYNDWEKFVLFWCILNIVAPIIIMRMIPLFQIPWYLVILIILWIAIIAITVGNILLVLKYKYFRTLQWINIGLNLVIFIFIGGLTFVTSIPAIPDIAHFCYRLIIQNMHAG